MNKGKIKYIAVLTCATILFSGCATAKEDSRQVSKLENRVAELEQQVSDLQGQVNGMNLSEAGIPDDETSGEIDSGIVPMADEKSGKLQQLIMGDSVSVPGNGEFTFDTISWEDDVKATKQKKAELGLEDKEGETYLIIRGTFKNLSKRTIPDVDNHIQGTLIGDKQYSCGVKMLCEDKEGKTFHGMPNPDQTLNMVVYASASDELLKQFQVGKLIFYLNGSNVKYQMSMQNSSKK